MASALDCTPHFYPPYNLLKKEMHEYDVEMVEETEYDDVQVAHGRRNNPLFMAEVFAQVKLKQEKI